MSADDPLMDDDCISCGERLPRNECPASRRPCGHHCNHSWSHEHCDWCGRDWDEDEPDADDAR